MFRALALFLAAFALLLSPVLMADAGAAMPAAEPVAMTMDAHCAGMLPGKPDGKNSLKIDCAAACSALHASAPFIVRAPSIGGVPPAMLRVAQLDGIDLARETPPPRNAPEI
ncbi:hypothetical protein GG804_03875 [Sphingomonas histidinilytica]|jgi:hypothetical protein|uniref:hypothetical protein n=1 Tax=Rhizorhabdus histidinilytica TaxID=439228 RepID=UPI000F7A5EAB|nr:hypothetical protein [Rhizorhabdus histidinilytica]MBO9375896.1 hypothetical protein [Rhizorhabdus histidinilytica]QEH81404.1 hypothetical protein EIK56_26280 [Sphingomonas sp. C8-2]